MARITTKITSIDVGDGVIEPSTRDTLEAIVPKSASKPKRPTNDVKPKSARDVKPADTQKPDVLTPKTQTSDIVAQNDPPKTGWITAFSVLMTVLWLGLLAYLIIVVLDVPGSSQSFTPLTWLALSALVLLPLLTLLFNNFAMRQLVRLSGQMAHIERLSHALLSPDETVIAKSNSLAAAIRTQITNVNTELNQATEQMGDYEQSLARQISTLDVQNENATQKLKDIEQSIAQQVSILENVSQSFDVRMTTMESVLDEHSTRLIEASEMAEEKLKEARISIEGAASKLNSASDVVRGNIVAASTSLSSSHHDIQSLGDIIGQRSSELDAVYKKHATELKEMVEHLRDEQASLGSNLEARLNSMRDMSLSARSSAESLIKASDAGRETVEALAESASLADQAVKSRFAEMQDLVEYSTKNAQSISDKAARRVKDSLELTRKEIMRIVHEMVELQSRIEHHSTRVELEIEPSDVAPSANEAIQEPKRSISGKTRKSRSRLKLQPLPEDDVPPKKSDNSLFRIVPDTYDEPDDTIHDATGNGIPDEPTLQTADPTQSADFDPLFDSNFETDIAAPATPAQSPKIITTPHYTSEPDSNNPDTETVRRAVPETAIKEKSTRSGLGLRGLFGWRSGDKEDASFGIIAAATKPAAPDNDAALFEYLDTIGLSPNAVVDDGCIIEAVNARVSKGHDAMSDVVLLRLKGPVEHLHARLNDSPHIRESAIRYAARFDQSLAPIQNNREAIRTQLESEQGRAYLLLDAALNLTRLRP